MECADLVPFIRPLSPLCGSNQLCRPDRYRATQTRPLIWLRKHDHLSGCANTTTYLVAPTRPLIWLRGHDHLSGCANTTTYLVARTRPLIWLRGHDRRFLPALAERTLPSTAVRPSHPSHLPPGDYIRVALSSPHPSTSCRAVPCRPRPCLVPLFWPVRACVPLFLLLSP